MDVHIKNAYPYLGERQGEIVYPSWVRSYENIRGFTPDIFFVFRMQFSYNSDKIGRVDADWLEVQWTHRRLTSRIILHRIINASDLQYVNDIIDGRLEDERELL